MTQSLSCWKHLISFLRCHLVIFSIHGLLSLRTFEIIFNLWTLRQSDYTDRKNVKVVARVIESLELIFSLSHWFKSRARITMSQSKYYQNMIFGHWLIYLIFSYKSSFFILSQSEYYDIAILYFKWLNLYHAENISKVSWEVT